MSRRKRQRPAAAPGALLRRRAALGVHLALQGCVLVGSQGPWWDVLVDGERLARHAGYDAARAAPMEPVAFMAAVAAIVAFFFASYDLVADADIQGPVLAASLVALVAAGALVHRVLATEDAIRGTAEDVARAQVHGAVVDPSKSADGTSAGAAAPPAGADVAPVGTSRDPLATFARKLSLKPAWGMALLVAAAPLMVIVSLFLTFFAERAPEPS
ncbi:MAG: hypothetical protein M9894_23785 [Planctomycetes bacterium]|nr:hypothetical protein [Planctomycetota bacterium]